jgi:hypothetical protein
MAKQTLIKTSDGVELYCPEPYASIPNGWDVIKSLSNGCGAQGWKVDIVPDSILDCKIVEACNIHDIMYGLGETIEDKDSADRTFLNNMQRLIEARTAKNWVARKTLLPIRKNLAYGYYIAVHKFGGVAFWKGK